MGIEHAGAAEFIESLGFDHPRVEFGKECAESGDGKAIGIDSDLGKFVPKYRTDMKIPTNSILYIKHVVSRIIEQ